MVGTAALAALGMAILPLGASAQTVARAAEAPSASVQSGPAANENGELARALQRELKRLGCLDGEANGIWGENSRAAFKSFVRHAKLTVEGDEPNVSVLDAASAARVRVCSVAAKADESKVDDRRETKPRQVREERQEPVKAKEPKRVEKEQKRPAAKPREAREPKIEREPKRIERAARAPREPREREARAYSAPRERESANSGKRLCFGAGRNELVTCQ